MQCVLFKIHSSKFKPAPVIHSDFFLFVLCSAFYHLFLLYHIYKKGQLMLNFFDKLSSHAFTRELYYTLQNLCCII